MKSGPLWIMLATMLAFGLASQPVQAASTDEIRGVIEKQVDAFRRDDRSTAFSFASPNIQQKFGTPDLFMAMVESGYPQIYRAAKLTFLDQVPQGGRLLQKVLIEDAAGSYVTAVYAMVVVDGAWRIDGCWLLRPGTGV